MGGAGGVEHIGQYEQLTKEPSLRGRTGGAVTLELATGAAAAIDPRQGRITAESAKKDRLARMMEGEPVLSAAVQAWDLELVD